MLILWCITLVGVSLAEDIPDGPQGPPGATVLKYDLISMGAFTARHYPEYHFNAEHQEYREENVDLGDNEILITARKDNNKITSGRLDTYGKWSTAQSADIKMRGYLEVRTTFPTKPSQGAWGEEKPLPGAFPAVWMLGVDGEELCGDTPGAGSKWPGCGEIDIMETFNGNSHIFMTTHSTHRHGGSDSEPQHPAEAGGADGFPMNADFTQTPLIAGLEWNVQDTQVDLTWWFTWCDAFTQEWTSTHKTLVLTDSNDKQDFYNSFTRNGFNVILNLAEGSDWLQDVSGMDIMNPQYMRISSAKVYGFY